MTIQKKNTRTFKIFDLTTSEKDPTDNQLTKLMKLVGEDGKKSCQNVNDIIRQRRQAAIARGHARRQAIFAVYNEENNKRHGEVMSKCRQFLQETLPLSKNGKPLVPSYADLLKCLKPKQPHDSSDFCLIRKLDD